jgi:leucyl/phenylalanyl-tRNA--protein transferase
LIDEFDFSVFPAAHELDPDETGLVALGGQLTPETVVEAYSKGVFPWSGLDPIPWFSPDPRLILIPQDMHRSKSLRKLLRQERITVKFDGDFPAIITACAEDERPGQDGTWINGRIPTVYTELFERGIVHCVGAYQEEELVGGLYGLSFGRAFFGESMFALIPNASKIAFSALCDFLAKRNYELIDCQQETAHLSRFGAISVSRADFLRRLQSAFAHPSQHESWEF